MEVRDKAQLGHGRGGATCGCLRGVGLAPAHDEVWDQGGGGAIRCNSECENDGVGDEWYGDEASVDEDSDDENGGDENSDDEDSEDDDTDDEDANHDNCDD